MTLALVGPREARASCLWGRCLTAASQQAHPPGGEFELEIWVVYGVEVEIGSWSTQLGESGWMERGWVVRMGEEARGALAEIPGLFLPSPDFGKPGMETRPDETRRGSTASRNETRPFKQSHRHFIRLTRASAASPQFRNSRSHDASTSPTTMSCFPNPINTMSTPNPALPRCQRAGTPHAAATKSQSRHEGACANTHRPRAPHW